MFNSDTPFSTHSHSDFSPSSEVATMQQIDSIAHKLKPRSFHKSAYLWVHSADFHPGVNCAWQYYQTSQVCCCFWAVLSAKPSVTVPSAIYLTLHFKVQMASSYRNSSTPVPPLGTPFNMILHFSDQMAYLPNIPRCSRWIHQRGRSFLRSPSSTIQPGWTVLPVPGPSIVPADNDPNWEDAFTTNPNTNLTANRPTSSTRS